MENKEALLFLHIPKAAGTTIIDVLRRQYRLKNSFYNSKISISIFGNNWVNVPSRQRLDKIKLKLSTLSDKNKKDLQLICGHMDFGWHELLPQKSKYFTILREPISRAISYYYYILGLENHYLKNIIISKNMNISDFVQSEFSLSIDNGMTRLISGVGENLAFNKCSDETLLLAKQNLDKYFSIIGLTEYFDETLILLKRQYKWKLPFYVRRNTRKKQFKSKITTDEINIIKEHNKYDMELYKYAVEKFKSNIQNSSKTFFIEVKILKIINQIIGFLYKILKNIKNILRKIRINLKSRKLFTISDKKYEK